MVYQGNVAVGGEDLAVAVGFAMVESSYALSLRKVMSEKTCGPHSITVYSIGAATVRHLRPDWAFACPIQHQLL